MPSHRTNNRWVYAGASKIHGQGLFARADIPADTLIVEYDGPRLPAKEARQRAAEGNVYIFRAKRREFIDGSVEWNLARHANHSCLPNARSVSADGGIWLRARRAILAGEEITYDYGFSFRDESTPCSCGSSGCAGVILSKHHRSMHAENG